MIYGYVFHDTHGQNIGRTLKTQWFLLNEMCTDTHLQDCCGKDSPKDIFRNEDRKMYRIGNVYLLKENKVYSFRFMWMTLKWQEKKQNYGSHVEEVDE